MAAFNFSKNVTVAGINLVETRPTTITGNQQISRQKIHAAAAAKTGTLTTRTDDNTGELTMSASHGITTGARLDVYWTVGGVFGCRRGMTVGTVATNAVPIDGGTGDVLPAAASAVVAMVPVEYELKFTGNLLQGLAMNSTVNGSIVIADGSSDLLSLAFPASYLYLWSYGTTGLVNPLASQVPTKVFMSVGDVLGGTTTLLGVTND